MMRYYPHENVAEPVDEYEEEEDYGRDQEEHKVTIVDGTTNVNKILIETEQEASIDFPAQWKSWIQNTL